MRRHLRGAGCGVRRQVSQAAAGPPRSGPWGTMTPPPASGLRSAGLPPFGAAWREPKQPGRARKIAAAGALRAPHFFCATALAFARRPPPSPFDGRGNRNREEESNSPGRRSVAATMEHACAGAADLA